MSLYCNINFVGLLRFSKCSCVPFQTLSVEFIHDHEGKAAIEEYMGNLGYYVHSEVTHVNWLANDFIFVKK